MLRSTAWHAGPKRPSDCVCRTGCAKCFMAAGKVESFAALQDVINDVRLPVARACQAIEECINSNRDNLRGFFETCFPLLVKNLFGYDGPSWLSAAAEVSCRFSTRDHILDAC